MEKKVEGKRQEYYLRHCLRLRKFPFVDISNVIHFKYLIKMWHFRKLYMGNEHKPLMFFENAGILIWILHWNYFYVKIVNYFQRVGICAWQSSPINRRRRECMAGAAMFCSVYLCAVWAGGLCQVFLSLFQPYFIFETALFWW